MKKRKDRTKRNRVVIKHCPEMKMSELIVRYASDYINMGNSTQERQSYLNGACTAWNIAILPEHLREEALHRHVEHCRRMNPGIDYTDNLAHDLRILVEKKLQLFPDVKKVILHAVVEPVSEATYRIMVTSTDNPGQLSTC